MNFIKFNFKKRILSSIIFFILPLILVSSISAQNIYKSKTSGRWITTSNWEMSSNGGSTWTFADHFPSNTDGEIIIAAGTTMEITDADRTVDQLTIESNAELLVAAPRRLTILNGSSTDAVINGTLDLQGEINLANSSSVDVYGTFKNSATQWIFNLPVSYSVTFKTGGVYKHEYTTTSGTIPFLTWESGSNCLISGYTSFNSKITAYDQTFQDVEWNCPNQIATVQLPNEFDGMAGDLTIVNTGSGSLSTETGTTLNGNLVQSGGDFGSLATLYVKGNLELLGGTMSSSYIFMNNTSEEKQLNIADAYSIGSSGNIYVYDNSTVSLSDNIDIDDGDLFVDGTLKCDTLYIEGNKFELRSDGTLEIGHENGIKSSDPDGNIRTTTRTFSTSANFVFKKDGSIFCGDALPATVKSLSFDCSIGYCWLETEVSVTESLVLNTPVLYYSVSDNHLTLEENCIITGTEKVYVRDGNFIRKISSDNTYEFPVGTFEIIAQVLYLLPSPATLQVSGTGYSNAYISVGIQSEKHPNNSASTDYLSNYWTFEQSGITNPSFDAEFTYLDSDINGNESNLYCGSYDGLSWSCGEPVNSAENKLSFNGLSDLNDFTGGSVEAMPVELISFNAYCSEGNVNLEWNTSNELNNFGFEIERATNDLTSHKISSWKKVGFVKGAGNSNTNINYKFSDKPISGTNFIYRLKQIDNDGQYKYSYSVEIILDIPKEFALNQNYPNPFNPETVISFELPKETNTVVKIYDILGNELYLLLDKQLESGYHKINFNAESLTSGIYFYRIETEDFTSVKKMILTK